MNVIYNNGAYNMQCICDARNGTLPVTVGAFTMCCPINSTIVNGTCGCNSSATATTKYYVGSNVKFNLDLSLSNPIAPRFVCLATCPANSSPAANGVNSPCECNDGYYNNLTGTYPYSNFYCTCLAGLTV